VTRVRVALFALLFVSFAYFYQAGGWNQNSRFALVRAITNEGTLNIDPFQLSTGDKAFFGGHYYSDKAPGIALTAVPVVAVARPIYRTLFHGDAETYEGLALMSYLAAVFTAGLFTALAGVALFTICLELGASRGGALFAAITFGLATPIWTLATIFIGHAFAASLLVFAFCATMRIGARDSSHDVRLGAIVGIGAGWAVVSDFTAGVPAIVLAIVAAIRARPLGRERALRILGTMTVTAIVCAAVLFGYLYACFGSPFHIPYTSELDRYPGMEQGFFGINPPRLIRLRRILFGSYRGLLPIAPTLALAPFGYAAMALRGARARTAAVVAAILAVYFIVLNASYTYWEGGWSYGPRQASPAIPFLCVALGALWSALPRAGRWILAVISAYGVAVTLVAVSTMPLPPADIRAPLADFMLPAFRDGDLSLNTQTMASGGVDTGFRAHHEPKAAFNLGMKMGLDGRASLVPLAIVWLICGLALGVEPSGPRMSAASRSTSPPGSA